MSFPLLSNSHLNPETRSSFPPTLQRSPLLTSSRPSPLSHPSPPTFASPPSVSFAHSNRFDLLESAGDQDENMDHSYSQVLKRPARKTLGGSPKTAHFSTPPKAGGAPLAASSVISSCFGETITETRSPPPLSSSRVPGLAQTSLLGLLNPKGKAPPNTEYSTSFPRGDFVPLPKSYAFSLSGDQSSYLPTLSREDYLSGFNPALSDSPLRPIFTQLERFILNSLSSLLRLGPPHGPGDGYLGLPLSFQSAYNNSSYNTNSNDQFNFQA